MAATQYSKYFNIDEKYYAVVTKALIDEGKVKWEGFYPHETFLVLLRQVIDMLSGKENKSIWVEGSYGTGKSHAALTVYKLLEASESEVRAYFADYGLSRDLCDKFLAARSEQMNGKLIVVHRIGSANIKNDEDLIWAVQSSVREALAEAGIDNHAHGTLKDALLAWVESVSFAKTAMATMLAEHGYEFGNMNVDQMLDVLNSDDASTIDEIMSRLMPISRQYGIECLRIDAEKMAAWLTKVIEVNKLGGIVFIWDEFSEFFKNCQNSLTGFQTLAQVSMSAPFYFMLVTHESDGLIVNMQDRNKISNRFIEPRVRIELPDNMAFRLMKQAMKETDDPVMRDEWHKVKNGLNVRVADARRIIVEGSKKKIDRAGDKARLNDEDLQDILPIHPYAALILKHISRVFTASQRSMFDFLIARDPDEDDPVENENLLVCRGFKWFINHHGALQQDNMLTVDQLWDFFNAKAGGNMNPDALEILKNFETLTTEFNLDRDQQRVLKTVLLMNAICTRVGDADMLMPTYENIELAFKGSGWSEGKASSIARGLVHRAAPQQPVLFEEPLEDGKHYRVIPKATGGVDVDEIKKAKRAETNTKALIDATGSSGDDSFEKKLRLPENLTGHFQSTFVQVNPQSVMTFKNGIKQPMERATNDPDHFEVCILLAMTDLERGEAARSIAQALRDGIPENLLFVDATANTFEPSLEGYITNRAYQQYYQKSNGKQSGQFGSYAQNSLVAWVGQVASGQFRLYDAGHPDGQVCSGFDQVKERLQQFDREMFPYGIEQYSVLPTMFTRQSLALGAECGITQTEKQSFSSSNPKTKLSNALAGAWKAEGRYWEDPAKQDKIIVKIKQRVEEIIADGFDRNGRVEIIDIFDVLRRPPFGMTPCNLTAFVLGFVLKEYANEQYIWSNTMDGGKAYPMDVDKMKGAIKGALDQVVSPSPRYKPDAIVTTTEEIRTFLKGTAHIFNDTTDSCGTVGGAAGVIRTGMKRLEFPIWCVKSILNREHTYTDSSIIAEVIDRYLGVANIKNYSGDSTESDLATEIGARMMRCPMLVDDLSGLLRSDKCREGMKAYLAGYRGGRLPELAAQIKDNGAYISELKKKFNADEANWVWSADTVNDKIDDVILDYSIIAESNEVIASSTNIAACARKWREKISNFRISLEAMESDIGEGTELHEFMKMLSEISGAFEPAIPEIKRSRFLELLRSQKNEFIELYNRQFDMFKRVASGWLGMFSEVQDVEDFFTTQMEMNVFNTSSEKFFKTLESKITAYNKAKLKTRLKDMWREKTGSNTSNPREWSYRFMTPILCMFDDNERMKVQAVFEVFDKQIIDDSEAHRALEYLESADFYERLASREERDHCMRLRVIGDFGIFLNNVDEVREHLRNQANMVHPYNWMDNSSIRAKIEEKAKMRYQTEGASRAQAAIDNLDPDEMRIYLKRLIKSDMSVGIAILKKQPQ